MTEAFTAMSWNVQGEIGIGEARLQRQLNLFDESATDVDLFLLQAVNYVRGPDDNWKGQLGAFLNYFADRDYYVAHTGDWAAELSESTVPPHTDLEAPHNRCNLTASRWPIERRSLTLRNRGDRKPRQLDYYYSHFPEKILVTDIELPGESNGSGEQFEVWNVGIINGSDWGEEKLNMLETVYARVHLQVTKAKTPVLLGGDFNAPKLETADREIAPHGRNGNQYTTYPFYGDPHHLRDDTGAIGERRFDQRWQRAEARIFDPEVGDWELQDTYWTAQESARRASTEDYTHIVHTGTPSRKRLDHLLVSEQFNVHWCEIWNGQGGSIDGFGASDHAPVVVRVDREPN